MCALPSITRMEVGNLPGNRPAMPEDLGDGTVYYVSASTGWDGNDGLSPATAWQTVEPVNRRTLQPGDSVLFCRGDVFVGQHLALHGDGRPTAEGWITVDAYGQGEDPLFTEAIRNEPAVSLQAPEITGGYRIRHLQLQGYRVGIAASRPAQTVLDGLQITDCTVRECTIHAGMDFRAQLPCGAPLACGLLLQHIRNLEVRRLTIHDTDCPLRFCGGLAVFDRLDIRHSHIQGLMLYGVYNQDDYEAIMATDGYVTVENSRVLYTGDRATRFGSTGCLLENIHHATVRNVEVGYTVNTLGGFDACGVDWESSNIDCAFESIYAHDNQGPFVLAMEHPESLGNSRRNVIRGCVSVNNGMFGGAESCSFINYSSYDGEHQTIRVEDCTDLSAPGVVAYTDTSKQEAGFAELSGVRKHFPLDIRGFTAGVLTVSERFQRAETAVFSRLEQAEVADGRLVIYPGGEAHTVFSGENYAVSCWMKGSAALRFLWTEGENGYVWRFRTGELLVACCQGGIYRELGRIALPGLDTACWFRLRVEAEQGTLSTYLNDILVDTRQDATFTVGGVAFCGEGVGLVRELYIYRYAPGEQKRATYEVAGTQTALRMDSAHGEFGFFSPETTWQPENMKVWQFRPFRAGWGEIADYEATITRKDFDRDVTGLTHLQVVMTNLTPRPEVWLEFTADGETWHRKGFSTACMDASQHPLWRVLYPAFTPYVLDMRDTPAWTGRITGLRLRFAAGFGTVAVKTVTLFAPEIGEEYTDCFRA